MKTRIKLEVKCGESFWKQDVSSCEEDGFFYPFSRDICGAIRNLMLHEPEFPSRLEFLEYLLESFASFNDYDSEPFELLKDLVGLMKEQRCNRRGFYTAMQNMSKE